MFKKARILGRFVALFFGLAGAYHLVAPFEKWEHPTFDHRDRIVQEPQVRTCYPLLSFGDDGCNPEAKADLVEGLSLMGFSAAAFYGVGLITRREEDDE